MNELREVSAKLSSGTTANARLRLAPKILRRWTTILGLVLVLLFVLLAVFADVLAPNPNYFWPTELKWKGDPYNSMPHPPGDQTILGTVSVRQHHQQMDVFSVLAHGSRSAVVFGLTAALFTCLLGTLLGAISAMLGGWLNDLIMRITDAFLTLPIVVGVVIFEQLIMMVSNKSYVAKGMIYYGSNQPGIIPWLLSLVNPVLLAIILFSWMPYARMTNAMVLRIKRELYVTASRSLGAGNLRILFTHLIPNSLSPSIILLVRDIGGFVLLQSTFTFIDLGGESIWGSMLAYARDWIIGPAGSLFTYWWTYLPVTLALVLFGVGWNLLGDAINQLQGYKLQD